MDIWHFGNAQTCLTIQVPTQYHSAHSLSAQKLDIRPLDTYF